MPQNGALSVVFKAATELISVGSFFYSTGVLLRLTVVVDAYEQKVVCKWSNAIRILLTTYLVNGSIGVLIELQFQDNGW